MESILIFLTDWGALDFLIIFFTIVAAALDWFSGNFTLHSLKIGIIIWLIYRFFIKPIYKSIASPLKQYLQRVYSISTNLDKVEKHLNELYFYESIKTRRFEKIIGMYTEYLVKVESLPKDIAKTKSEFIITKFGTADVLETLYNYEFGIPFSKQDSDEFKLLTSKHFLNELSPRGVVGEISEYTRKEVFLNIYNLWFKLGFKELAKAEKVEEIFLTEDLPRDPKTYWEYWQRKRIIQELETLGIIKLINDYQLGKDYQGDDRLTKRKFRFTTLNLKEIGKKLFPDSKAPNKNWLRKQVRLERENTIVIFYVNHKGGYLSLFWEWIYVEYTDDEF